MISLAESTYYMHTFHCTDLYWDKDEVDKDSH